MRIESVVVAARPMAIGTRAHRARREGRGLARRQPDCRRHQRSRRAVINRGLLTAVLENEPITANKVAAADGAPDSLRRFRAACARLSVRGQRRHRRRGICRSGSRVDLVVTMRRPNGSMTRTAASNVQVLTAGTRQDQGKPDDGKKPNQSTVVTLMVTPEDAERIALAQSEGEIMLVLRNPLDTEATTIGRRENRGASRQRGTTEHLRPSSSHRRRNALRWRRRPRGRASAAASPGQQSSHPRR